MPTTAITIPAEDIETILFDDSSGKPVRLVHGSVYIPPFLYGCPRGFGLGDSGLIRISKDDFTVAGADWFALGPNAEGRFGGGFNGACVARGKLYTPGFTSADIIDVTVQGYRVLQWDPSLSAPTEVLQPVFQPGNDSLASGHFPDVIVTDGDFLYVTQDRGDVFSILKVDLDDFSASWMVSAGNGTNNLVLGDLQLSRTETWSHSGLIDGNFLYFARTSGNGVSDGGNTGVFTLVKIHKDTGNVVGFALIPKTTDDMTQDENFIYLGVEVTSIGEYGYTWGAVAVRKSDMAVFQLPRLHASDVPGTASFASLVFGNLLIDLKANNHLYIIDKSSPETWSLSANVDDIVLADVLIEHDLINDPREDWTHNEMHLDEDGFFVGFLWPNVGVGPNHPYSGAIRFQIPGFNFTGLPDVVTRNVVENVPAGTVTLRGDLVGTGGAAVTDHGFYFGQTFPPATKVSLGAPAAVGPFETAQPYDPNVPNYVQAYATNAQGEGHGAIVAFGPEAGTFEGVVTLEGVPVQGAIVTAIHSASDTVAGIQVTGADGSYQFAGLTSGDIYHLCVEYDNGAGGQYSARSKPFTRAP